ncbi:type VI secretion system tip protein VgrG, partial [Citrobacter freundii]
NDETLVVSNDRRISVKGKQEHTTTGDHISLVKGTKSLEVKGDLAEKISGALGIKVQGDIVLKSSSRISLKVGGSFIDIHPGGVDIVGAKINLNGGGSPGDVIQPLSVTEIGEYNLRFHFTDDDDVPYKNTKYIAKFPDGSTKNGVTDDNGRSETFFSDNDGNVLIHLLIE